MLFVNLLLIIVSKFTFRFDQVQFSTPSKDKLESNTQDFELFSMSRFVFFLSLFILAYIGWKKARNADGLLLTAYINQLNQK